MRFGAEELFKEERNDEENKKRLLSMDIDEILERAEKVEQKGAEDEAGHELLSAFKARISHIYCISSCGGCNFILLMVVCKLWSYRVMHDWT